MTTDLTTKIIAVCVAVASIVLSIGTVVYYSGKTTQRIENNAQKYIQLNDKIKEIAIIASENKHNIAKISAMVEINKENLSSLKTFSLSNIAKNSKMVEINKQDISALRSFSLSNIKDLSVRLNNQKDRLTRTNLRQGNDKDQVLAIIEQTKNKLTDLVWQAKEQLNNRIWQECKKK